MKFLKQSHTHIILLFFAVFMTQFSFAQTKNGSIKGTVKDTTASMNLESASINLLDQQDSSLISFTRSKADGTFLISKLKSGKYILTITYTGYKRLDKNVEITDAQPEVDLGAIQMQFQSTLDDVVVTAAPIVIKGDTVEYDANSFKVNKPNAVVEDLFKRLPGLEVEKDGTIKANGQEVKRIMVDGKQFFANDPKLASKNLQADMVKKVQVFEKKSDKAEFTGIDDGESEPTINLTLKEDKRNGIFGRVSAGAGANLSTNDNDFRYQGNTNINSFKKGEQISLIGQANNVNQQNFSLTDALNGGASFGTSSQGITGTQAIGLNYNNFKKSNLEFTGSYFFNGTQFDNNTEKHRQNFIADSSQYYNEFSNSSRDNNNHRLNFAVDWKIDSMNSIKITPSFTYQTTNSVTDRIYETLGDKLGLLTDGSASTTNKNNGYTFSGTALYRRKFQRKGRTFSAQLVMGNNRSDADGTQLSVINNYLTGGSNTNINQVNSALNKSLTYNITGTFTEPVSKKSLLEMSAYRNNNSNTSDRKTYDYNPLTNQFDLINDNLTNYLDNSYSNTGAGLNLKTYLTGWNYTIGAKAQYSELSSLLAGKSDPIKYTFFNILPSAQLQISKNRYRTLRVNYNGTTSQPSVRQLQPIEDISDPLNIIQGNPDLKQSFSNNLRVMYNSFDPFTMKSFFATLSARQTFNDIVSNDMISASGARKTTYLNVNGTYNLNGSMNYGFPVKIGAEKAKINLRTGANYIKNINMQNSLENKIKNLSINQNVSATYNLKEIMDFSAGGGINWSNAKYSLQPQQNTNYYTYTGTFDYNLYIPNVINFGTDVDYIANTGRAAGYNTKFTLWNMYVSKNFLKSKKAEVKFSVNDILNQNKGITRNSNANYIEDINYLVLKRYFLVTLTYNLSKFGMGGGSGPRIMGAPMIIRQ
ncbi:outer membrane beta-barrel protein [Polluticaenibacter yanchengensis]|uniref:Outer membrane beta-barrel protein n=1 Tax=Polluticaenibacter yanchengensis TaxID=3014562 RepID=A0ABT4UQ03_9BACT|nr:outer membrane beta-barrel protein [Chitinophagaceae bacterium LY-5]